MSTSQPPIADVPIEEASELPAFQGYNIFITTDTSGPTYATEALGCATDDRFITSDGWAGCCKTTESNCGIATACAANTVQYDNGDLGDCGADYSCVTMTIYQTSGNAGEATRNVFCGADWPAHTIYRALAETTTTQESSAESTGTESSGTTITQASQTSAGAAETGGAASDSSSSSKAWIAGAVVGPLAVIAGIIFVLWILRRRAAKDKAAAAAGTDPNENTAMAPNPQAAWSQNQQYQQGGYDNNGGNHGAYGYYDPNKPTPELATPPPQQAGPVELGENVRHEMDGGWTSPEPRQISEMPAENHR